MVIDYGTLIKTRRQKLGLSQGKLADAACVHRTTVWSIETGNGCNLDRFLSVVNALGLKIDFREVDE